MGVAWMDAPLALQDADGMSISSTNDSVAITVCANQEHDSASSMLVTGVETIAAAYLLSSSVTFCSSRYALAAAELDSVLLASDIVCVDAMSALFVGCGFVLSYAYHLLPRETFLATVRDLLLFIAVDIVLSHAMVLVVGTAWCVNMHSCNGYDAMLTVLEGLTGLRWLDVSQTAWHSMNVTAWPACCLFWCLLLSWLPLSGPAFLKERVGAPAVYLLTACGVAGVLALNVMAVVHRESDLFYANSTNLMYRLQEFTVGVNLAFLVHVQQPHVLQCMEVLGDYVHVVAFLAACTWWGELGVRPEPGGARCMRMYVRNDCLPTRGAFLCRGGFLGVVFVASCRLHTTAALPLISRDAILRLRVLCTAVSFCWPVYILFLLAAGTVFDDGMLQRNAALLSAVMPALLLCVSSAYDCFAKPQLARALGEHTLGLYHRSAQVLGRLRERSHAPIAQEGSGET